MAWQRGNRLVLGLSISVVLAACGGGSASTAGSSKSSATIPTTTTLQVENQVTGYAATGNGWAMFLQFTKVGHQLDGTIQSAQLTSGGRSVSSNTDSFTGTVAGQNVTLSGGFSFDPNSISGTIVGSSIDLDLPGQNGQLYPAQFQPSTVAKYDAYVATLQEDAATQTQINNAQAAAAAAQQQLNNQVDAAVQAVNNDESNISSGVSSLQGDASYLAEDVSAIQSDLNTANQDLQQTRGDATANPSNTCLDAGNVQNDFRNEQNDQNNFNNDLSNAQNDLGNLQTALSALTNDWSGVVSAERADPSYMPVNGLPGQSDEVSISEAGAAAIPQFKSSVSSDQQTISNLLSQGQSDVSQANQLCTQSG